MQSIQSFFENKARNFSIGNLEAASASLAVPTLVYVGDQRMVVKDQKMVCDMLRQYRANLGVEDFSHSEVTILHEDKCKDGKVRALVAWENKNSSGGSISSLDASYFCEQIDEGGWRVTLVEIVTQPKARLASGLPMH